MADIKMKDLLTNYSIGLYNTSYIATIDDILLDFKNESFFIDFLQPPVEKIYKDNNDKGKDIFRISFKKSINKPDLNFNSHMIIDTINGKIYLYIDDIKDIFNIIDKSKLYVTVDYNPWVTLTQIDNNLNKIRDVNSKHMMICFDYNLVDNKSVPTLLFDSIEIHDRYSKDIYDVGIMILISKLLIEYLFKRMIDKAYPENYINIDYDPLLYGRHDIKYICDEIMHYINDKTIYHDVDNARENILHIFRMYEKSSFNFTNIFKSLDKKDAYALDIESDRISISNDTYRIFFVIKFYDDFYLMQINIYDLNTGEKILFKEFKYKRSILILGGSEQLFGHFKPDQDFILKPLSIISQELFRQYNNRYNLMKYNIDKSF